MQNLVVYLARPCQVWLWLGAFAWGACMDMREDLRESL